MTRRATGWVLWLALSSCATTGVGTGGPAVGRRAHPGFSAEQLMAVCWPPGSVPTARVGLTFELDGGMMRRAHFEALDGATNAVARCVRGVAWAYPWKQGEAPERLEVYPPPQVPSGWVALAYRRLMSSGLPGADSGVEHPAPLVAACIARGGMRPQVRYRVAINPVRVFMAQLEVDRWVEVAPMSEAERCIVAVLGATPFPTTGFLLDFSSTHEAPVPAPAEAVAAYFGQGEAAVRPFLDPLLVKETLTAQRQKVAHCWESTLQRRWGLQGGRTLRFLVSADGLVEHVRVGTHQSDASTEAADYVLDQCLIRAMEGLRFPNPARSPAEASYSWVFASR